MLATAAQPSPYTVPSPAEGLTTERAIVVAAQRGSDDAFSALVRIHQRRAYALRRGIGFSHEDAEGAGQEGFLHSHRALERVCPDPPFGAGVYRVLANAAPHPVPR